MKGTTQNLFYNNSIMAKKNVFILFLALITGTVFYACEPDDSMEPATSSTSSAKYPYCYQENGKQVCYKVPK